MLKREWAVERNGKLPDLLSIVKLQLGFLSLQWKTCIWTDLQPCFPHLEGNACPWTEHFEDDYYNYHHYHYYRLIIVYMTVVVVVVVLLNISTSLSFQRGGLRKSHQRSQWASELERSEEILSFDRHSFIAGSHISNPREFQHYIAEFIHIGFSGVFSY